MKVTHDTYLCSVAFEQAQDWAIGRKGRQSLLRAGKFALYIEIHANGLSVAPMVCRNSDSL